jgi:uncharacterized protein YehS (DUF1456 family)
MSNIYNTITFDIEKDLDNKKITVEWIEDYLREQRIVGGQRVKDIQINHYLEDLMHIIREDSE